MADGPSGEAKSGQQKPLPFNFRTPLLELSKDNSKARITWNCQGHVLQDHREHIVASVDQNNRTQLSSPWSLRSEAERKLQTLLADLGNGTSWLNMYKKTAKVCEEVQDMPLVVVNTYDFGTDQKLPHHMDQSCVYYQDDHGDDDDDDDDDDEDNDDDDDDGKHQDDASLNSGDVMQRVEHGGCCTRFNVSIRWHQTHYEGCP